MYLTNQSIYIYRTEFISERMIEYAAAAASLFLTTVFIIFIRRRVREENYLVRLDRVEATNEDALVSVIIPARNEEATISKCIEAVLSQVGVKKEVIVIDDASEDNTSLILLKKYLSRGLRLVRLGRPEEGWVGKSWACHHGYLESNGDWLLFIDADTFFVDKYVIRDTLGYAIRNRVDALSLIPTLDSSSIASRTILPTLVALKYVLTPPRRSNNPNDPLAFFYGAYMLFRRSVYESVGGHARVRSRILEDKNLGELTKAMGFRVVLLDARDRLRAKFNESFGGYVNALLRLFTEYAESAGPRKLWKYLAAGLVFMVLPLILAFYPLVASVSVLLTLLMILPLSLIFTIQAYELDRLGAPIYYFPLVVFSLLVIVGVLFSVAVRYRWIGVKLKWRGREYRYGGPRHISHKDGRNI